MPTLSENFPDSIPSILTKIIYYFYFILPKIIVAYDQLLPNIRLDYVLDHPNVDAGMLVSAKVIVE